MSTVQDKGSLLPGKFTTPDGAVWVLLNLTWPKPYARFPNEQAAATDDRTHRTRHTPDEAQKAYKSVKSARVSEPNQSIVDTDKEDGPQRPAREFSMNEFLNNEQTPPPDPKPQPNHSNGDKVQDPFGLLERERQVRDLSKKAVVFSQPIISRDGLGIIGRSTVNVIQGAYGSHKSRLAETLGALMLTTNATHDNEFLGFIRAMLERFALCYIDSERNQSEELPYAIQNIKQRAGYALEDTPAEFRFTSIKAVPRKSRFKAIEGFIRHVRERTSLHLVVIIDVITDAIGDFNDSEQAMQLFDFLGTLCDRENATVIGVIHQNPGSEKARGHAGTEAANKASTVLQIGFEKDANGNDTDLIRLRYLKLRRGRRPEPVHLQFSEAVNGLVLANAEAVASHAQQRKRQGDTEDVAERLSTLLSPGPMQKSEVWSVLEKEFKSANRKVRDILKTIVEQAPEMYNEQGQAVRLSDYKEGRNQFYKLELIT